MTAWWTFDEASGPVAHDIAGTIDSMGTHVGAPVVIAGQVGNALRFNGTTQYVSIPDGPDVEFGTGNLSIDAWVRTTSTGVRTIADKRVETSTGIFGYMFFIFDGRLGFQLADRAGSSICSNAPTSSCTNFIAPATTQLVNDGRWHHVAVTVARGVTNGGVLYVDGTVVLPFDPTLRPLNLDNSGDLWIARHSLNSLDNWNGDIDEVELFRRALTQPDVQAVFAAGPGGKCKGYGGNPSLIQSDFGTQGNFEVVVPYPGGGIAHYYRDNDDPAQTWYLTTIFGQSAGIVNAVSLIQSTLGGGNFEVVARIGDKLAHFYRDNSTAAHTWYGPVYFASGVAGTPSLIQSDYFTNGNFEVVTPLAGGGIAHYWRNNDDPLLPWYAGPVFGTSAGIVDDVSMIQSKPAFGPPGDFDVVARIGDQLAYFRRANPAQTWLGPDFFATGVSVSGTPSLIQSRFGVAGNFEVVAPRTGGGMVHLWRANDLFGFPWGGPNVFGSGSVLGVSLIQSNYANNFEVVAQFGNSLEHYWRDTPFFNWHGPNHVAP